MSLRAQTVTDWVCELHNDDPSDPFPATLVQSLGDPRIRLVQHQQNLGPIETFNQFYRPTEEPFYGLLEDDNTWEPTFLETMLAAMDAHPEATLSWCNQRILKEKLDGSLCETGTFSNPPETEHSPRLQPWGHNRQITGALHANGAMLLRSRPNETYITPQIPFGSVEAFRERMFHHPLVYVPKPLATFTITLQTARKHDHGEWGSVLAALAGTYVKNAQPEATELNQICNYFRAQTPPMTDTLISAALACREVRPLLGYLRVTDWVYFLINSLRHPCNTWRSYRVRTRHPDWWDLLDCHTRARFREATSTTHTAA